MSPDVRYDSLRRQANLVRVHFPGFTSEVEDGVLVARGRLRPCELCEEYLVGLAYAPGVRPIVRVLDPEPVQRAHGQRNPHLNGDGTICLYDPDAEEWDDRQPLALTILPWTAEWLLFYEWWLATGEWHGGGVTLEELLGETGSLEATDDAHA